MSVPIVGSDVSAFVLNDDGELDLDPFFVDIDEQRSTAEACARRLLTPDGALPWDPDAGYDLGQFLNADLDRNVSMPIRAAAEAEVLKDDRVGDASVGVTIGAGAIAVSVDASGPAGGVSIAIDVSGAGVTVAVPTAGS